MVRMPLPVAGQQLVSLHGVLAGGQQAIIEDTILGRIATEA